MEIPWKSDGNSHPEARLPGLPGTVTAYCGSSWPRTRSSWAFEASDACATRRKARAQRARRIQGFGKFVANSRGNLTTDGKSMGHLWDLYIYVYIYRLIGVFVGNSCDIGTFMGTIDKTWVDHGWFMENSWECGKIWQTTGWFLGNWYHGTLPRIFDMGWS